MREDVRRECQVDREDCALCEGDVRVLGLNVVLVTIIYDTK